MSKRKTKTIKTPPIIRKEKVSYSNPLHEGPFYQQSFFRLYWKESLVLLLLSFLLYFACIPFGYVLDDQLVITDNAFTKKGISGISDIMTTESFTGYFGEQKNLVMGNRYRPLSLVSFAIEYELSGGLNPKLSHIVNILLYALTGILLMQILVMLFRNYKTRVQWMAIPFLASLFFIAHPIHTEAVANIKGRDEIMSMLFSLAALYGALRFMDGNARKWLIFSIVSYFLGLLSKENALTFLAVIPLSIYFFSNVDWLKLRNLMLALLFTTIAYLLLRFNTAGVPDFNQQINDVMNNPFLGMTGIEKMGTILYTLGKYILLLIFPHPLTHDYYPYAIPKVTIFNFWSLLSLITHFALIWIALRNWKSKSVISYAILFYLVTLSIVSNIVINLGTFMNERFIFMASAGYCLLIAYFISVYVLQIKKLNGTMIAIILSLIITAGYSFKTFSRVPDWEDTMTLNQSAVNISSNSARANSFMATALFEKFKVTQEANEKKRLLNEAEVYAQKAVDIIPDYSNGNLMMCGVVSERFKMDYNIKNYVRDMKPVILRRPDIPFLKEFSEWINDRRSDHPDLFEFYLEIGTTLMQYKDKRSRFALQYLEYAYKINPNNRKLLESMATAYELNGNMNEANRMRLALQNLN